MATKIGWTHETWNPLVGCSRVSEGCRNCYAERLAGTRLAKHPTYAGLTRLSGVPKWTGEVRVVPSALDKPKRWRRGRLVFVCSMSDLFHERVQPETWAAVYSVMLQARQHVYQVLTKRPARMAGWLAEIDDAGSHVWHGVSVEDQRAADERVPVLLEAAARQRFLSVEPLLGPVDLQPYLETGGIGWVIVGGESGPNYRPMQIEWLEAVVDACKRAGVPVFVKQDCGRTAGKQGRIPAHSWVQQWPASMLAHLGAQ